MKLFGREIGLTRSAPVEERAITITQNASREELLAFFGLDPANLPHVTPQSAMRVPAFNAGVSFLSRTMATLTMEAFRETPTGPAKVGGRLQTLVRDAPNPEWSSYHARRFFWQNVLMHGRGLIAIVRNAGQPYELWPLSTPTVRVSLDVYGHKSYAVTVGQGPGIIGKTYPAADIIDVPWMLADNMCNVLSPVLLGEKALQLALAMNDYGANFFAGGGVPPLALEGPQPQGSEAFKRAVGDIQRAIDNAKKSGSQMFGLPPGHKLSQVGYDPQKGQMTEARLFQVQEIARVLQLPPVFLQDLSRGTFANTEQQDVFLVKHLIAQLATALEQEMNLKLFGQMNGRRYVRHDLDSLQRGDFLSRMQGLAASVNGAVRTPQEARRSEGLPDHPNPAANDLYIQGATVALGTAPKPTGAGTNEAGNQGQ